MTNMPDRFTLSSKGYETLLGSSQSLQASQLSGMGVC
jgi:hypothetical protein